MQYDIAIIGGGMGGIAAALAAARNGKRVFMSEETHMIGGQVTSQGVPPDEHDYIEKYGRTESYKTYRDHIRNYYRTYYPITKDNEKFNPGNGWVSELCHEPIVSLRIFENMLHPYVVSGKLKISLNTTAVSSEVKDDTVKSVTLKKDNQYFTIKAEYFLDATELGDLLPLTNTEYVTGSESKADTNEMHAIDKEDPLDMQAVTWCFAVSFEKEGDYTIEKPHLYDYFKNHRSDFWTGSQLDWTYVEPHTLNPVTGSLKDEPNKVNLFKYRQILDKDNFEEGFFTSNITLINWPQNDYWLGPVYELDLVEREHHLYMAKELSKSFLYWLQTEADGTGYPNLKPRGDVMGTDDGFALKPYIRESRRIVSKFRVEESHIGALMRTEMKSEAFYDTVGLGHYHLDLHPSTGQRTYIDIESYPFQIPMGALMPIKTRNLIPACKNIGTTHITNGTYRLHPVEWNIGESAALMSVYAINENMTLDEIRNDKTKLKDFQDFLLQQGVQLEWPDKVLQGEE